MFSDQFDCKSSRSVSWLISLYMDGQQQLVNRTALLYGRSASVVPMPLATKYWSILSV